MHMLGVIVGLCYLNCASSPQGELCHLCQCAVSILTVGLHAIASANESSVNNGLLTANGMGSVCRQPIRVQELLRLYLHPQLIIDRNRCDVRDMVLICFVFSHTLVSQTCSHCLSHLKMIHFSKMYYFLKNK